MKLQMQCECKVKLQAYTAEGECAFASFSFCLSFATRDLQFSLSPKWILFPFSRLIFTSALPPKQILFHPRLQFVSPPAPVSPSFHRLLLSPLLFSLFYSRVFHSPSSSSTCTSSSSSIQVLSVSFFHFRFRSLHPPLLFPLPLCLSLFSPTLFSLIPCFFFDEASFIRSFFPSFTYFSFHSSTQARVHCCLVHSICVALSFSSPLLLFDSLSFLSWISITLSFQTIFVFTIFPSTFVLVLSFLNHT